MKTPSSVASISGASQALESSSGPDFSTPQCPSCLTALRFTDKFCCWCGEAQPLRNANLLTCVQCTTLLPTRANFCYSCGTAVLTQRKKVQAQTELFKDEQSEEFPRFEV